jgi:hypothetical protein
MQTTRGREGEERTAISTPDVPMASISSPTSVAWPPVGSILANQVVLVLLVCCSGWNATVLSKEERLTRETRDEALLSKHRLMVEGKPSG